MKEKEIVSLNDQALYVLKLEYVEPFFIMRNNTRALRYSKIEYLIKEKKWSPLFFEYVNGQFSVENTTRGFTYSSEKKTIIDDDDDGTVNTNYAT